MTYVLNQLLTLLVNYGYPIVIVAILMGAIGVPLPISTLLLAAGSLAFTGDLNLYILIGIVTVTALTGDMIGYFVARKLGSALVLRHVGRFGVTRSHLQKTNGLLSRWGRWSVFFTRWLLTPLGVPVNIVAGLTEYPLQKFVIWAGMGEFLWSTIYINLGYLFGDSWNDVVGYVGSASQVILLLSIGILSLYLGIRYINGSHS